LQQAQKNLRGIVAMTLAMALFVLNDTCVKLARVEWETGQVMVVRGVFALILLAVWLRVARQGGTMRMLFHPTLVLRGALEGGIAACFIGAIGAMPLADITAILMLAPLIITALSTLIFGEKVGWRRWSAVIVGFCGMLLVVQPGGAVPLMPVVLAVISVLGVGFRDLLTRRIPAGIPSVMVAITSSAGTLVAGVALSATGPAWHAASPHLIWLAGGAAGFVVLGNYAMIEACREAELSVIAPFRYVVLAFAVLLGILVFDAWPTPIAVLGLALIGASGLYTLHRERVRRRVE
jgi:drug/metabolite transporter (DMT)-like permease